MHNPFFSWTPVPGASRYRFELNNVNTFPPTGPGAHTGVTSNPFYFVPAVRKPLTPGPVVWYWRVVPIDAGGNEGLPSTVFSFRYTPLMVAPQLVAPLYYYVPNSYGANAQVFQPEDRTASLPVFAWSRFVLGSGAQAAAYRLQVSTDETFPPASIVWQTDTVNLSVAPTEADPFSPLPDTTYYWRVTGLTSLGGDQVGEWSQIWRARFDLSAGLAPAGPAPQLLRPAYGSEWTETTPQLEWSPVDGAEAYDVTIGTTADLSDGAVTTVRVPRTVHTPREMPQYPGDPGISLPYGTYWWRVCSVSGGVTGECSSASRFQIAAQSRWRAARTLGAAENRNLVATAPAGDVDAADDLSTLYVAQAADYWHFGFDASTASTVYGLYLDLDHTDGSGGTSDPRGYAVTAIPAHRPEYAVYVLPQGGSLATAAVAIYPWTEGGWGSVVMVSPTDYVYDGSRVEFRLANTLIGMIDTTQTASLALFSVHAAGEGARDAVPADPLVAGGAPTALRRFASASDRLAPSAPPNRAPGEGVTYPTLLPSAWSPPVDTPWYGYQILVAVDEEFTTIALDYTYRTSAASREPYVLPYWDDIWGDNTYYWRVRPVYSSDGSKRGAWSEASVFERQGAALTTDAMAESTTFATPTFSWQRLEGAKSYDLQVSRDPAFGTTEVNVKGLAGTSYTWTSTLAQAEYYWRVRARREATSAVINDWSPGRVFTLVLPMPAGLGSVPSAISGAPTLYWSPLLEEDGSHTAVLAAWKYRVQVSRDDTFSAIWDTVDTEQPCWTPTKGYYDDADYFWRVAMIDGQGKAGSYSPAASFQKAYPLPALVSPVGGATSQGTPTFVWKPLNGAAAYKVEVSTNNFVSIKETAKTNNCRWTPTSIYAGGGITYYWRVRMIDKDGREGSAEFSTFIVDPSVPLDNPVFLPRISVR